MKPLKNKSQTKKNFSFLLTFPLVDGPMFLLTFSTAICGGETNTALVQFQSVFATLITSWNTRMIVLILFKTRVATILKHVTSRTINHYTTLTEFITKITTLTIRSMNIPMGKLTFLVAIVHLGTTAFLLDGFVNLFTVVAHSNVSRVGNGMAALLFYFTSIAETVNGIDGVGVLVSIHSLANGQRLLKERDGNCGLLDTDISISEIVDGRCVFWMLITKSIASKLHCF